MERLANIISDIVVILFFFSSIKESTTLKKILTFATRQTVLLLIGFSQKLLLMFLHSRGKYAGKQMFQLHSGADLPKI